MLATITTTRTGTTMAMIVILSSANDLCVVLLSVVVGGVCIDSRGVHGCVMYVMLSTLADIRLFSVSLDSLLA
jgi:hypothetical protein